MNIPKGQILSCENSYEVFLYIEMYNVYPAEIHSIFKYKINIR